MAIAQKIKQIIHTRTTSATTPSASMGGMELPFVFRTGAEGANSASIWRIQSGAHDKRPAEGRRAVAWMTGEGGTVGGLEGGDGDTGVGKRGERGDEEGASPSKPSGSGMPKDVAVSWGGDAGSTSANDLLRDCW